jgi:hypothetical protein
MHWLMCCRLGLAASKALPCCMSERVSDFAELCRVYLLLQDRTMFPLSMCVARLSGAGADSLFVGLLRAQPVAGTADNQVVKVCCCGMLSLIIQSWPNRAHVWQHLLQLHPSSLDYGYR